MKGIRLLSPVPYLESRDLKEKALRKAIARIAVKKVSVKLTEIKENMASRLSFEAPTNCRTLGEEKVPGEVSQ